MDTAKKVAVLLAAYNGEHYIEQQIDSILSQTYPNFELYIWDDGSSDSTRKILSQYAGKHSNLHLELSDVNLGYPASFYALTDMEINADYFMFSDQDDVWCPEKIERMVELMDRADLSIPTAYFSGYYICDENLNVRSESAPQHKPIKLHNTLFEVCGLEFTMAINKAAKELLFHNKPQWVKARGTWMCMLYSALGVILYDNRPSAFYRRHSSAVTSSNMGFFGLWKWRIKTFFGGGFEDYKLKLQDFYSVVGDRLPGKERKMVYRFSDPHYLKNVIYKVFYPKRLRRRLFDELMLRFTFLIGKL
ncbi:MAG: glycosyltransferase [Oscillospiraceae bacterium]|nr:glycosyltransferase [Oscillospiraceae bacterium]